MLVGKSGAERRAASVKAQSVRPFSLLGALNILWGSVARRNPRSLGANRISVKRRNPESPMYNKGGFGH